MQQLFEFRMNFNGFNNWFCEVPQKRYQLLLKRVDLHVFYCVTKMKLRTFYVDQYKKDIKFCQTCTQKPEIYLLV